VNELAIVLSERFLRLGCGPGIGGLVEAGCRDLGGEPVGLGQAHDEGDEGILNLLLRQLLANLVERLDSLDWLAVQTGRGRIAHLLPDEGLLYRGKVLERGEQHVGVLGATDVLDKLAEFLAQCSKHFVLILDRLYMSR
jgi:hypothetical protein